MQTIKHNFVSGKADGADTTQVRPSNWNDSHSVTGTSPSNLVNVAGAFPTFTGTGNPTLTAYEDGMVVLVDGTIGPTFDGVTTPTIDIDGLGAIPITDLIGIVDPQIMGKWLALTYDATANAFRVPIPKILSVDQIFFYCPDGTIIGFSTPISAPTNPNFIVPTIDGTTAQALVTDGAGMLSFADPVGVPVAVTALPGAPRVGQMASVNDALAPAVGVAVANGGAAFAAVMWNGAQWTVFSI